MSSSDSGAGIAFIIGGLIIVSLLDTVISGSLIHWLVIIAAIVVGLMAVSAIKG